MNEAEKLVNIIDKLMSEGSGHVNVSGTDTVTTFPCPDCTGEKLACAVPSFDCEDMEKEELQCQNR